MQFGKKHARVSFSKTIKKLTSVCFFKLHEKPYYYLLIIYMKKFRVNYIFICSQSSAIGMRNLKSHHRQPNVVVACAQAHVAQARDCIVVLFPNKGNNTTIQSLACATCACAQATITLGCLWSPLMVTH